MATTFRGSARRLRSRQAPPCSTARAGDAPPWRRRNTAPGRRPSPDRPEPEASCVVRRSPPGILSPAIPAREGADRPIVCTMPPRMPLPRSLTCTACKHTYPEGWCRCPYCGFDPEKEKRDKLVERVLSRKFPRYAEAIQRDRQRSRKPGRDEQRPGQPAPQQQGAQAQQQQGDAKIRGRRRRGRRRGQGGSVGPQVQTEGAPRANTPQANAPGEGTQREAPRRELRPPQQQRPPRQPQAPQQNQQQVRPPRPPEQQGAAGAPEASDAARRRRRRVRRRRPRPEGGGTPPSSTPQA